MNELNISKNGMTSLEIAEVTGRRHDNILRDIRGLLAQGVNALNFEEMFRISKLGNGATRKDPYYNLTPKGCLILASGYDAMLREKIINRLEELETNKTNTVTLPDFTNPSEAARAWASLFDENTELKQENNILKVENNTMKKAIIELIPKAEIGEAVSSTKGCIEIGDMANILKQNNLFSKGRNVFYEWLREEGMLIKQGPRRNMPSQKAMNLKAIKIVESVTHSNDGKPIITKRPVVTMDGQRYFLKRFGKHLLVQQTMLGFLE